MMEPRRRAGVFEAEVIGGTKMASWKRSIAIVGAGQAGLQLGCGMLDRGYDVLMVQERTAEEVAKGKVMSSQCMFDAALQNERDLKLNFWDDVCPTVDSISLVVR